MIHAWWNPRIQNSRYGGGTIQRANCKLCTDFPLQGGSVPLNYPTLFKGQLLASDKKLNSDFKLLFLLYIILRHVVSPQIEVKYPQTLKFYMLT